MVILGIETSCDETAAAVLERDEKGIKVLSNIIASSASLQSKFGGIIPEQAAREQLKSIIPVIETALSDSGLTIKDIDAIAVTQGPGLIGSLLIGVETAKTLALIWDKPLIPVNHLIGHFYANWIEPVDSSQQLVDSNTKNPDSLTTNYQLPTTPTFPIIGLLVSGGHTDLVLFTDHNKYQYLGGTRDDAAGECFDKCARLLGLPYPGGPEISKLAKNGDPTKIKLPKPMLASDNFDFSFSGLKTAVANIVSGSEFMVHGKNKENSINYEPITNNLAASIESTIVEVLIKKTIKAAEKFEVNQIMIAGGVAANRKLSVGLRRDFHGRLFSPSHNIFCTDNAAMIAAAGFFTKQAIDPLKLQANPNLSLS